LPLDTLAQREGRDLGNLRDRPGVTAAIVGARTAKQLLGALAVEELSLPPEIVAALDDVSED
jgi:aryl-alcohol dehydrogenase-like predicted oxidoreductase